MRFVFVVPAIVTSVLLAACATTGSGSSSARPVFYPNATLTKVGEAKAREEADVCIAKAQSAGLTPDEKTNAVAHDAARGAAVGGVAGSVGSLVTGKSLERSLGNGVAGAAVGGSVGAVSGAFKDKPNTTYRRFVQRCLTEKGFDVIGWN